MRILRSELGLYNFKVSVLLSKSSAKKNLAVLNLTYYSFFVEDFLKSWGSEWVACVFIKGYFNTFWGIWTRKNHPKIEVVPIVHFLFSIY